MSRKTEVVEVWGVTSALLQSIAALMKKHVGTNFATFLTDARIENAKRLLCDVTLNIGEVASTAGFDDPRYFARRFKQKTGSTPRTWRELQGRVVVRGLASGFQAV